jgi:hypothetical protein
MSLPSSTRCSSARRESIIGIEKKSKLFLKSLRAWGVETDNFFSFKIGYF